MTRTDTTPHHHAGAVAARHLTGLDGMRAIAAFAVLVHHASFFSRQMYTGHFAKQFTQLDVGVAIFFLLSGFLLFRPFVERCVLGRPSEPVRGYLLRRAARIFPAYWLALTLISVIGKATDGRLLGLPKYPESNVAWAPYYLLVHVYRSLDEAKGGMNQVWTLAVEITFYAFLPLWAWLVGRLVAGRDAAGRLRGHSAALVVLFAVGIGFRAVCSWGPSTVLREVGEYWLPAHFDVFALGMGLAVASVAVSAGLPFGARLVRLARGGLWWWAAAVVVFCIGANPLPAGITERPDHWLGIYKQEYHAIVGLALLLPVVFAPVGRTGRPSAVTWLLERRAMVFAGTVSYGVYLWHQAWIGQAVHWSARPTFGDPIVLLIAFGAGASVATAAASWFAFERPIVRWATRRTESSR